MSRDWLWGSSGTLALASSQDVLAQAAIILSVRGVCLCSLFFFMTNTNPVGNSGVVLGHGLLFKVKK